MLRITQRIDVGEPVATLTLPLEQRVLGRLRVSLDDGRDAGLFLDRGPILRGGDLLRAEDGSVIRVQAAAESVSVARTDDAHLLARLYGACVDADADALRQWGQYLLAARETRELRLEEQQRAAALTRLLRDLDVPRAAEWTDLLGICQTAPYALAAVNWRISLADAALGLAWSWLENMVAAAIKLVPLGQTDGQRVQLALAEQLPAAVQQGLELEDEQVGASSPMLALASSLHETQYTRLFRS